MRYARPLSLILFDLDGFKAVNDRYGHLFGDAVLRKVASAVEKELRAEQIFARVGGDEFAILSPESAAVDSRRIAERIRERVLGLDFIGPVATPVPLGASFGIAELGDAVLDSHALFAAADEALYSSKEAGSSRITVFARKDGARVPSPPQRRHTRSADSELHVRPRPHVKPETFH
jgi:diguanylate cyclase (GGDEF)-like protein